MCDPSPDPLRFIIGVRHFAREPDIITIVSSDLRKPFRDVHRHVGYRDTKTEIHRRVGGHDAILPHPAEISFQEGEKANEVRKPSQHVNAHWEALACASCSCFVDQVERRERGAVHDPKSSALTKHSCHLKIGQLHIIAHGTGHSTVKHRRFWCMRR